jgi:hypothetical protein
MSDGSLAGLRAARSQSERIAALRVLYEEFRADRDASPHGSLNAILELEASALAAQLTAARASAAASHPATLDLDALFDECKILFLLWSAALST